MIWSFVLQSGMSEHVDLNFVVDIQVQKNGLANHGIFVVWFVVLVIKWGDFVTIHSKKLKDSLIEK